MTKILSKKITQYLIQKGIIDSGRKQWCIYALEKRISTFITMSFIVVVCGLLFGLAETLMFTLSMVAIRKRTGGYHAKTPISCLTMSLGLVFSGLYIAPLLLGKLFLQGLMLALSFGIVYLFAPVNHPNLKLTAQEMAMNRKLSLKITALTIAACIFLSLVFPYTQWGVCSCMGIACAALSVVAAKILRQEVKINEKS